jgi:hypothetical protein
MRVKITLLVALAAALLVAPQASAGPHGLAVKAAKAACRAELDTLGREGFRALYGAHPARTCMRQHMADAQDAIRNASQECRAEREADPAKFAADYGENANGRNAFGKCVSRKVRQDMAEEVQESLNAARACRAERRADPAQFAADYGTRPNAFGKCVSAKARAADEAEEETPAETPPPPPAPAP